MNLTILLLIPYVIIFIFGIVIGSFLNVCVYRLPLHESIITTPSHCMSCGNKLKWYDLVPVFSWMVLGGKCRYCKAKISAQYPLVEFTNGFLYIITCLINGLNWVSVLYCLLASALLTLSLIDFRTYEIPVGINWFIAGLGIIHLIMDWSNWSNYLFGMVCVSGLLLLLYLITKGRAIGGGDIKLMAAAGLLLGWKKIILAFLLGCIIGSVCHLLRMKFSHADHILAMGPYLSIGIFLAVLWGEQWISLYLGTLGIL